MNTNINNTISNIKISVSYEETPCAAIQAALERLKMAQEAHDLVETEANPIIQKVNETKIQAILRQIQPLLDAYWESGLKTSYIMVPLAGPARAECEALILSRPAGKGDKALPCHLKARCGCDYYSLDQAARWKNSIVTHWEEWGIYKFVESALIKAIDDRTKRIVKTTNEKNELLKEVISHN